MDKRGKSITVHFTTVTNYLKQYFGKPRKIRKVFFMSEENKKKRVEFCKKILKLIEEKKFLLSLKIEAGSIIMNLVS